MIHNGKCISKFGRIEDTYPRIQVKSLTNNSHLFSRVILCPGLHAAVTFLFLMMGKDQKGNSLLAPKLSLLPVGRTVFASLSFPGS